jgi:hypothetical protein
MYEQAAHAGVNPRTYVARKKNELVQAVGGRDYLEQFRAQRDRAHRQQFSDYGVQRTEAMAPVTAGRRRGVNTGGVGGSYGARAAGGMLPHQAFGLDAPNTGMFGAQRDQFKNAGTRQFGLGDFESMSLGARNQMRNVAFEQFFNPQLSGTQAGSAGGTYKLAAARGIRGRAARGASAQMAERFKAGNRRAALDFIMSDLRQSAENSPGNVPAESELQRILAQGAAFNLMSRGRTEFKRESQKESFGLDTDEGYQRALLQGKVEPASSGLEGLRRTSRFADMVQGVGTRAGKGGSMFSQVARSMGTSTSSPIGSMFGLDTILNDPQRSSYFSGYQREQDNLRTLTSDLQRDLFSGTSGASIEDILAGNLDRGLSRRVGTAGRNIDTIGGTPRYQQMFSDIFGSGVHGAFDPLQLRERPAYPARAGERGCPPERDRQLPGAPRAHQPHD